MTSTKPRECDHRYECRDCGDISAYQALQTEVEGWRERALGAETAYRELVDIEKKYYALKQAADELAEAAKTFVKMDNNSFAKNELLFAIKNYRKATGEKNE